MAIKNLPRKQAPKPRILRDIVRRIVDAAHPEKIILFGSAARAEMGPNSDVDLLVVKAGKFNRRHLAAKIYDSLYGAEAAVDVVIVTPAEVRRYRDAPGLVIFPALREGRVAYGS
jgi:predicted nucleotidyltransferase